MIGVRKISTFSVKRDVGRKALSLEEMVKVLRAGRGVYPACFFTWLYSYFGFRRLELLK